MITIVWDPSGIRYFVPRPWYWRFRSMKWRRAYIEAYIKACELEWHPSAGAYEVWDDREALR